MVMCRNGMKYFSNTFTEIEAAVLLRHGHPPLTRFEPNAFDVDVEGPQTEASRKAQEEWRNDVAEFVMQFALPERKVSARRWSRDIAGEILYRNIQDFIGEFADA